MNKCYPKTSNSYLKILEKTHLGQMYLSKQLFYERYEILRILGRGGFGITFLAKNVALPGQPLCVIKQLCPQVRSPKKWERAKERFVKEAKALGQLGNHSQIPMLLDYFEINGEFYLIQEYIRGYTLAREIKQDGPKSEAAVKQFLREIIQVLQYVHNNCVIHRDIKPHNLLRSHDDGRLVLIDFGAVREELIQVVDNSHQNMASTNFIGTMGFAPPEQFSLRPVYASDIYAVGVTCLYLLTGKSPLDFDYDSHTGEIYWRKEVTISNHFAGILDKMLKISLEERFKSANEVLWALGMESHLPSLTECLTTHKLSNNSRSEETHSHHSSPITRTAKAIREWRKKLNARNSQNNLHPWLSEVKN